MLACLDSTATALLAKGLVSPEDMDSIQKSVDEKLLAEGITTLSPQLIRDISDSTDPVVGGQKF